MKRVVLSEVSTVCLIVVLSSFFSCSKDDLLFDEGRSSINLFKNSVKSQDSIISFSVLGNSISTYKGYIPSSYKYFSKYVPSNFDVEDTWWMRFKNLSGFELYSNASWSGSTVVNDGASNKDSYFTSEKRLAELGSKGNPDYIVVLGGTNDWGQNKELGDFPLKDSFNMGTFRGAYSYLIKRICELYPDATIVCCSILPRKGYDAPNKKGWYIRDGNLSIETIASRYDCVYVNLDGCGLQEDFGKYTMDGLHPNELGMELIANEIYYKIMELISIKR